MEDGARDDDENDEDEHAELLFHLTLVWCMSPETRHLGIGSTLSLVLSTDSDMWHTAVSSAND